MSPQNLLKIVIFRKYRSSFDFTPEKFLKLLIRQLFVFIKPTFTSLIMVKWSLDTLKNQLEAAPYSTSIQPSKSEPVGSIECEKCISAGFLEKLNGHFMVLSPTHTSMSQKKVKRERSSSLARVPYIILAFQIRRHIKIS